MKLSLTGEHYPYYTATIENGGEKRYITALDRSKVLEDAFLIIGK